MHKYFHANAKRLKSKYNRILFVLNILPISVSIVLAILILYSRHSVSPIIYYYTIFSIMTVLLAYSFLTTLICSIVSFIKTKNHLKHTYIEIVGETLVISIYQQTYFYTLHPLVYKKLYIINLKDIEDIYFCRRKLVIVAPSRMFYEREDWLTYKTDKGYIEFDRWWYDKNGAKLVNGVAIPDMFLSSIRIARTVSSTSGKAKKHFEARNSFRQKMLSIAQSTAFEHKNLMR